MNMLIAPSTKIAIEISQPSLEEIARLEAANQAEVPK